MTELSPQAQAVLDAVLTDNLTGPERFWARAHAAAAIRAAVDQPYEVPADIRGGDYWTYRAGVEAERNRNLAIAAELEGGASTSSTH